MIFRLVVSEIQSGGIWLSACSLVACILCFLPLFLSMSFDDDNNPHGEIYISMQSDEFRLSVWTSIAVSIPLSLDYIIDIFFKPISSGTGQIPRGLFLLSLIVPDAIIYGVVIPRNDPSLLVCIFHLRNAIITYAVIRPVWDFEPKIFKLRPIVFANFFFMIGHVLCSISAFTKTYYYSFFFSFLASEIIAFIVLFMLIIQWLKHLKASTMREISNLSTADLSINVFLVPSVIFGMVYIFLCIIYKGSINHNTTSLYLTIFTYTEAATTVAVFVFQGRFNGLKLKWALRNNLETKRVFVRFVSHEMRTPLNTAFMALDVLNAELHNRHSDKEVLGLVNDVRNGCKASIDILNELLDYDKIEAGVMQLDRTLQNSWDFLQETIAPFISHAKRQGIKMEISKSMVRRQLLLTKTMVYIDKGKIKQVFSNLLANAIKFTPSPGRISIDAYVITTEEFSNTTSDLGASGSNPSDISPTSTPAPPKTGGTHASNTLHSSPYSKMGLKRTASVLPTLFSRDLRTHNLDSEEVNFQSRQYYLRIEINDSGPGVTKENMLALNPHKQKLSSRKILDSSQITGDKLGLLIARSYLELHGGNISVVPVTQRHAKEDIDNGVGSEQSFRTGSSFRVDIPVNSNSLQSISFSNPHNRSARFQSLIASHITPAPPVVSGVTGGPLPQTLVEATTESTMGKLVELASAARRRASLSMSIFGVTIHTVHAAIGGGITTNHTHNNDDNNLDGALDKNSMLGSTFPHHHHKGLTVEYENRREKGFANPKDRLSFKYDHKLDDDSNEGGSRDSSSSSIYDVTTVVDVTSPTSVESEKKRVVCQSSDLEAGIGSLENNNDDDDDSSNNINGDSHTNNSFQPENLHVLVVDDIPMNRKLLIRLLRSKGFLDIREAEDGNVAVERVREAVKSGRPYDLITMDYQMPNLDGPAATSAIRAQCGFRDGPMIVGVTGNGMQADIDHFMLQGAERVFVKPVDINQLYLTIHDLWLSRANSEGQQ